MQIQVSYDCMGIGLQYKDPKVYYYLSLTAFPSGALLNYTLVYMRECSISSCISCFDSVIPQDYCVVTHTHTQKSWLFSIWSLKNAAVFSHIDNMLLFCCCCFFLLDLVLLGCVIFV